MYYYAIIDKENIVTNVVRSIEMVRYTPNYIPIDSYDTSLIGMRYEDGKFITEPEYHAKLVDYVRFKGKKISIVGDSISTFETFVPSEARFFYPSGDVTKVEYTWWNRVCEYLGMELCSDVSYSGSRVTYTNATDYANGATGYSDKRILYVAKEDEHGNRIEPDIIIILLGINDFANSIPVGTWSNQAVPTDSQIKSFREAYAVMLDKMKKAYPKATVFACTILNRYSSSYPLSKTDKDGNVFTIYDYNDAIRDVSKYLGAEVIDLNLAWGYTRCNNLTSDGLHPNNEGMKLMAGKVISELKSKYPIQTD